MFIDLARRGLLIAYHISIVYERLAGGYGIGYSEPLTCRFGQVDSSKRCIEVKIQFSEVGRLAAGDSCMLLAISKEIPTGTWFCNNPAPRVHPWNRL